MDKMRWRYGDTNPVVAAVEADVVIEIGDLLWQDGDTAKPIDLCDPFDFKTFFLGVATQRSRAGENSTLRVATTGVFEFDCEPDIFRLGDFIVPVKNQLVEKTIGFARAIGRVAKRFPKPTTTVLVDIRSSIMTNGVLA